MFVLGAVHWREGEGFDVFPQIFDNIGVYWQTVAIWLGFYCFTFFSSYLLNKFLPPKYRYYSTPLLQIITAGLFVYTMPWTRGIPEYFYESIRIKTGYYIFTIYEWTFLFSFIISQIIILMKPGLDSFTNHRRNVGPALRFQLLLLSPYLILSPLLNFIPSSWDSPLYALPIISVIIFFMVGVAPSIIKFVMKTKVMPDCEVKEVLENQAKTLHIKYNSLRIWESGRGQINAAVVGTLPLFRYLVITRAMVDSFSLPQIKQVFWHEFGHIVHKHMWVYFLFFNTVANLGAILETQFHDTFHASIIPITTLFCFGVGFSFVSRRLEKQADLYALQHSEEEESYCDVLKKLSMATGIPYKFFSLTHGSIKQRVTFLEQVIKNPNKAITFNRNLRLIIVFLFLIFLAEWGYWLKTYVWSTF